MANTYRMIVNILVQKFGFIILDEEEDFDIGEYITESIAFMQFIIAIEEEIRTELSDDFLNYDILCSARGFTEKLDEYIETLENT